MYLPIGQLDPSLDEFLYHQLYRKMKDLIQAGRLVRGERVPPTRELAGQLGLNRTTVSAAYELLEQEGLIRGHVGRGSFVEGPGDRAEFVWADRLDTVPATDPGPVGVSRPGCISFASSRPAEDLFPLAEFRATCAEVAGSPELSSILQLGAPGGYGPLRRYLADEAARHRLLAPADDLLVSSGCQQAMDLIARVLTAPGDTVVLEDPVYPGLKNVFQRAGVRVSGVPVGLNGLDLEMLERALTRDRPKLVVVTPNFQNPTGLTLSLAARRELLRLTREAGVPVVENDIYGDLRYEGEHLPSLKELDEAGQVVQVKSFSKIAFPGLRVGWILGNRSLVARLTEAKQWSDLHTDHFSQALLLRFAETGRLAAHLARMQAAGAERLRATVDACQRRLPEGTRFTRPHGGMSLWVRLPEPLDASVLLPRVERENVTYLPGRYFAVARHDPGALRLSFAGLSPQKIEAGLAVLGDVFHAELERAGAMRRFEPAPAIV